MSYLLRRSGIALCHIANLMQWRPRWIYQVGVGQRWEEAAVMHEMWPEAEFWAAEAHPALAKAARAAGYPGTVKSVAVGDSPGRSTLYSKHHHKDGSSLHRLYEMDQCEQIKVRVDTLDNLVGRPPKGSVLLWLDCEGSELAALRGAAEFLDWVEVVNVEMTSRQLGEGWCRPEGVHKHLEDAGFFRQWVHTQRSSAGQVDAIYVRSYLFKPEFCCCPCQFVRWNEFHEP